MKTGFRGGLWHASPSAALRNQPEGVELAAGKAIAGSNRRHLPAARTRLTDHCRDGGELSVFFGNWRKTLLNIN